MEAEERRCGKNARCIQSESRRPPALRGRVAGKLDGRAGKRLEGFWKVSSVSVTPKKHARHRRTSTPRQAEKAEGLQVGGVKIQDVCSCSLHEQRDSLTPRPTLLTVDSFTSVSSCARQHWKACRTGPCWRACRDPTSFPPSLSPPPDQLESKPRIQSSSQGLDELQCQQTWNPPFVIPSLLPAPACQQRSSPLPHYCFCPPIFRRYLPTSRQSYSTYLYSSAHTDHPRRSHLRCLSRNFAEQVFSLVARAVTASPVSFVLLGPGPLLHSFITSPPLHPAIALGSVRPCIR